MFLSLLISGFFGLVVVYWFLNVNLVILFIVEWRSFLVMFCDFKFILILIEYFKLYIVLVRVFINLLVVLFLSFKNFVMLV